MNDSGFFISQKFAAAFIAPIVLAAGGVVVSNVVVTIKMQERLEDMASESYVESVEQRLEGRVKFLQYRIEKLEDRNGAAAHDAVWRPRRPAPPNREEYRPRTALIDTRQRQRYG